jgi:hypothetical protein
MVNTFHKPKAETKLKRIHASHRQPATGDWQTIFGGRWPVLSSRLKELNPIDETKTIIKVENTRNL